MFLSFPFIFPSLPRSNDIAESFTAPEPTGWGLPVALTTGTVSASNSNSENTFSYQQFPPLSPALFGPVRPARVLLHKPEKGRQLSQSSKVLQETIEMRTRTLSGAVCDKSLAAAAAVKKHAMKDRMIAAKVRNLRVLQSIVKVQSLFRMLRPRRLFLTNLMVREEPLLNHLSFILCI